MDVKVRDKILSAKVKTVKVPAKRTLKQIVDFIHPAKHIQRHYALFHNGLKVEKYEWDKITPGDDDNITITLVPAGGSSGKSFAGAILGIALAYFTWGASTWALPALLGSAGITGGLATAVSLGVMFVGSLAINALFAPTDPGGRSGGGDTAGFLGMEGLKNAVRVHQPVRNIYGKFKVAPDIAAEPYVVTSGHIQTVHGIYDFGYGNLNISDLRIGNTPIASFRGARYRIHNNYKNEALSYYKNDNVTDNYAVEILNSFVTRTAPSNDSDALSIEISFPLGLFYNKRGSIRYLFAYFTVQVRKVGSSTWIDISNLPWRTFSLGTTVVSGQITLGLVRTQPFVYSISMGLPSRGEWEIRVRRNGLIYYPSAGGSKSGYDKTELRAIRSTTIRPPLNFTVGHTILELQIQGTQQLSGVVDTLTATVKRAIPIYNGSIWIEGETSNPAWIALDILRGDANPDPIPDYRIDLESFIEWSVFCERMAQEEEEYYHCDCNWDSRTTVAERLRQVMITGRAAPAIRENLFSVVWEQFPTVPVQLFTTKNSWGFSGTKVFTKQPHALKCQFIDPESEWQAVELLVYADGHDEFNSTYFEELRFPLCIRATQAWRDGRYFLAAGKLRPENFTLTADIENLICERGDLVAVQNDGAMIGGVPARVKSIDLNDITLDEIVYFDNIKSWSIRIRLEDGSQEDIDVIGNVSGDTITVSDASKIRAGDLLVYGEKDMTVEHYIIKSIQPSDDLTATILMLPIAREIEDADKGEIPEYSPPISNDDMLLPRCPTNVTATSFLVYADRHPFGHITLEWDEVGSDVLYIIYQADSEFNFRRIGSTEDTNFAAMSQKSTAAADYPFDTIYYKVTAMNALGYAKPLEDCETISVAPERDLTPPGKPLFFAGNISRSTMNLSWLPPDDFDIGGYILRHTTKKDDVLWDDASTEDGLIPYNATSLVVNARLGSYLLKTIDTSGNVSENFAMVQTTIPAIEGANAVAEIVEDPGFNGTLFQLEKVGNTIQLAEDEDGIFYEHGIYSFNSVIDVGTINRCSIHQDMAVNFLNTVFEPEKYGEFEAIVQIAASTENSVIADWPDLASIDPIADPTGADWGGWQNLTAGQYTGRYFKFRAILTTINEKVTPVISELKVVVDMPDRVDSLEGLLSDIGGTHIDFGAAFREKPAVSITGQNMTGGDYYTLSNINNIGFDIEFFDSLDQSISIIFDYFVRGYGRTLPDIDNAIPAGQDDDIDQLPEALAHLVSPDLLI